MSIRGGDDWGESMFAPQYKQETMAPARYVMPTSYGPQMAPEGYYYAPILKLIFRFQESSTVFGAKIELVGKMNPNGKWKCFKGELQNNLSREGQSFFQQYGLQNNLSFSEAVKNGALEYLGPQMRFETGSGFNDYMENVVNCSKLSGGLKKRRVTGSATRRIRVQRVKNARRSEHRSESRGSATRNIRVERVKNARRSKVLRSLDKLVAKAHKYEREGNFEEHSKMLEKEFTRLRKSGII